MSEFLNPNEKIKEHDSLEEYKDNMVKYAIVVIRRRALAEIRDGLKPIQRRILWDQDRPY